MRRSAARPPASLTVLTAPAAPPAPLSGTRSAPGDQRAGPAAALGALAMAFVGGSVAVSGLLADAPLMTAQALRYAAACALLLTIARVTGRPVPAPRLRELPWLTGVAALGLVLFNVALVRGSQHAEPAVLGVAVACVPLLLAVGGPLLEGRSPQPALLAAAAVVTAGVVLVQGGGRTDALGVGWALVVLVCEAGFTLLAVPLLTRLGAWGVSVHATWIAAVTFAVLGLAVEGPAAARDLEADDLLAAGYLAVLVTAVAFVLWYAAVHRLGAGVAGLLTGVAPVSAAAAGVALGQPVPGATVWAGIGLVAVGLSLGLTRHRKQELA